MEENKYTDRGEGESYDEDSKKRKRLHVLQWASSDGSVELTDDTDGMLVDLDVHGEWSNQNLLGYGDAEMNWSQSAWDALP
jgi:hypothetical protein